MTCLISCYIVSRHFHNENITFEEIQSMIEEMKKKFGYLIPIKILIDS